ncbi:MAG: CinA family protein [Oscillospiraceae bacterium]|nr:CinA family protein [Oscillospiraceae bacterium]
MMTTLCCKVVEALRQRELTLVTAESLTGGGIGAALTAVPGASCVYKGGVISYVDLVKHTLLDVPLEVLSYCGAVSEETAGFMAVGARQNLCADIGISVTGLAGPGGDAFGHPVGTVYIGFDSNWQSVVKHFCFAGTREEIRNQTIRAALELILENV